MNSALAEDTAKPMV